MRKYIYLFICQLLLVSCQGEHHITTVKELAHVLRTAYETGHGELFLQHVDFDGMPPDLRRILVRMAQSWKGLGNSDMKIDECKVFSATEYAPTTGIPGKLNGRPLEWTIRPSHIVVLRTSLKQKSKWYYKRYTYEFGAYMRNHRWLFAGARYANQ